MIIRLIKSPRPRSTLPQTLHKQQTYSGPVWVPHRKFHSQVPDPESKVFYCNLGFARTSSLHPLPWIRSIEVLLVNQILICLQREVPWIGQIVVYDYPYEQAGQMDFSACATYRYSCSWWIKLWENETRNQAPKGTTIPDKLAKNRIPYKALLDKKRAVYHCHNRYYVIR